MKVKLNIEIKVSVEWKQNGSQMFDVGHVNEEHQNDLYVKLFDVGHSNVKYQNNMNLRCLTVWCWH